MPRLLPKEYDELHRKRCATVALISVVPIVISAALALSFLNLSALMIGVIASSITLWLAWATPRPWSKIDLYCFTVWPILFFFWVASWVLYDDLHGKVPENLSGAMVIIFLAVFLFTQGKEPSQKLKDRRSALFSLLIFPLLLAYFSSTKGGADPMHKALMDWFHLTSQAADIATIAIRKIIHFTFYGFAGYLAFRYVIASRTINSLNDKWKKAPPTLRLGWQMALSFVAILAAYDEIRQLFSPNRSGSALDFLLDMAGASFFIWVWGTRYHKKVTNP